VKFGSSGKENNRWINSVTSRVEINNAYAPNLEDMIRSAFELKIGRERFRLSGCTQHLGRMRLRRLVTVVCAVVVCVQLCLATTVVVIIDPDRILIGSDSLFNGCKQGVMCKVSADYDNCAFAIVGLRLEIAIPGIDADMWARRACAKHLSISDTAREFGENVEALVDNVLKSKRRFQPNEYASYRERDLVLEAIFAGFEGDMPVVSSVDFSVGQTETLVKRSCTTRGPSAKPLLYGFRVAAQKFMDGVDARSPLIINHPDLVQRLVELEIAEAGNDVGPPISILEMTKNSRHFIKSGVCDLSKPPVPGTGPRCEPSKP
jgi:hypothetical protein